MTRSRTQPTREDVLDAFAVEQDSGRQTLERYLREFPQYAAELVDLSRELSRNIVVDQQPLSSEDLARIDRAWRQHVQAAPNAGADPFASLSTNQLREIATYLNVPRQVVTAFRQRKVIITSVPRSFLTRLAAAVHSPVDRLVSALSIAPAPSPMQSYRADVKPSVVAPVTFEQVLIDAGVSEEDRAELMSEGV